MTPLQIVLLVLLSLLAGAAALFALSWYMTEKRVPKFTALGIVVEWQDAKLPFFGRAIIQYTQKGKPMQARSELLLRSRKPRKGMKRMWTVSVYRTKNKVPIYVARKEKRI